ncbi:hypothetical protein VP01_183g2 [Puccinia sorghi]|uniref:Uncharacterized protein n=1 Tax=Puccinia sorghi TaxID=27349 RepID=A0A0L6VDP6_9BASI|nr:hypothetical protein VP01_183g2 [Puccinia sorghi]
MDIIHLNLEGLAGRVKDTFQNSENNVSASVLNSDVVEIINKMVSDGQVKRLNVILHDLNSLKEDKEDKFSELNILIKKLQRNIFQLVDYIYKQEIISAKALKTFFQMEGTLELAALNMYFTPELDKISDFWLEIYTDKDPISTLNRWDCANYRTLYEILDERDKRYFSYLSLRIFKVDFETSERTLFDSIFKDDHLFHTLEEYLSDFSKDSLSKDKKVLINHGGINSYSQIRNNIQALIERFHNSDCEKSTTAAFFILNFIQINYGLEILDVKKGDLSQARMNSMSSRFQLLAELQNIKWYMARKTSSELTLTHEMKSMGGEVVMIYKYCHLLLPKIQHFFLENDSVNYSQNHNLLAEKYHIELRMNKIMSCSKYYSLK